ncbi:MAG: PhaM family polyhydroxyalkanoate granule multifunctional regulatory protein [Gammaproteobacteria bacterium]
MTTPFGIGDLSAMGLPGGNPLQGAGILETMELVRKAWAAFSLPPNMAPTVDPDEVARRVSELKAVEQWLTMNLSMLRGTIQALEIQQGTLAALRAFGAAGAAAAGPAAASPAAANDPADASGAGAAAREPLRGESKADPAEEAPAADAPSAAGAPSAPDALNPVAWWDMLQKQFGEVAAAALAGVPAAIDAATGAGHLAAGAAGAAADMPEAGGATRPGTKARKAKSGGARAAGGPARTGKSAARGKAGAAAPKRGAGRGRTQG